MALGSTIFFLFWVSMVGDSSKLIRLKIGESTWDFSHLILKANWFDQSKPVDLEL